MSASPSVLSRLGPGRGLDPTTRGFFESNLHHDFSRTRIHDDSAAAESAASIDARAFTHGRDVVFGRGEYAPHTTEGRRLLAHELTHVVQQGLANGRGGIQRQLLAEAVVGGSTDNRFVVLGPFDAGDIHLDGGEIVIETADSLPPIRTVTLPPPYLHAGEPFSIPDSMVRLESEAEEEPEAEPLPPPTGEHANQQVGTWGRFLEIALMTGAVHEKSFATQEEAITFARSLGSAAAVFQEGEIFAVYPVHEDSTLYDLEYGDVRIELGTNLADIIAVGPVLAIITEDGNTIVPPHGGGDTWMKMRESLPEGAEADPYALHTQVFGEGLNQITDRDQFLRVFEMAMRDTTLVILDQSKAEAERQRTALSGGILEEDVETIARVTDALLRIDQAKSRLAMVIHNNDYAMIAAGRGHMPSEVRRLQEENDQKRRDIGELDSFRKIILLDYPLLSHIRDIEDFSESSRAERGSTLYDATNEVLTNIVRTRGNVLSGSLNLWALDPVVQSTLAGLNVTGETRRGWALGKASSERAWDTAIQIALAVLQIGFSIAAFAVGGPAGAVFAAAALGVGVTDAIMMTDRYLENVAAAGTDINVEEALVPADLGGEWVWVVLAWVGVGLDMADAVRAVRAIRAGTATLEETIPRLAREADLDESKLRRAATETTTDETARVLARTADRDTLTPAELATELREVRRRTPVAIDEGDYVFEVRFGGAHEHSWRYNRRLRTWCRFSTPSDCIPSPPPAGVTTAAGEAANLNRVEQRAQELERQLELDELADPGVARVQEVNSLDDIARFRESALGSPPPGIRSDADMLDWVDYQFYAERRILAMEDALRAGRELPNPPRTFDSFRQAHPPGSIIRNNIQGSRFEMRTAEVLREELGEEAARRWMSQPYVSESLTPGRGSGELTRPDFLTGRADAPGITAISNKSRQSFLDMTETSARARVIDDLEEAIAKYSGVRSVRRAGGATEEVTRILLLYDGPHVPQNLRSAILDEARIMERMYEGRLTLEVGFF